MNMADAATLTLSDFLLARIAEDEATVPVPDFERRSRSGAWYSTDFDVVFVEEDRWLAECRAKRAMVKRFAELLHSFDNPGMGSWPDVNRRERHQARDNLSRMAEVYADHPDYRQEWRP